MWLTASLGAIASYFLASVIYHVYFHPLRTYPGPKLYAAFRLPYIFDQLSGRLPLRVKDFHDKYGPVVRIAPDELAYNTAAAWRDIYGYAPDHTQLPKDLRILPPTPPGQSEDIIHANDIAHSRVRRLLGYGFASKALEEQHPVIMSYADSLIRGLHERSAEPQDLVAWYNWFTFDLIGDLSFGESFDCLKEQRYHPWVKTLFKGINGGVAISAAHRYGLGRFLEGIIPKSMKEEFELMWSYTRDKVARRLAKNTDRPDMISYLKRNDKEGSEMSQGEIEGNALTLVVAGSETTATLLAGVTYHLLQSPKILAKVRDEVRNTFGSEEDINSASASKLEYLTLVLKEAMRIYPPAPGSIPRKTTEKGAMLNGEWVPPHTTVGIYQWACNHSASNFHDPETFHPERWLDNPPSEFAADARDAMQTFSYGPRNCLGKNLAYMEMRIVTAKMLWNFDLSLDDVSRDWLNQKVYLIWAKHPLMVKLTPVTRG